MPKLTQWFVKLSFVYLVAALGAGLGLAVGLSLPGLRPVFFHLFLVGWVTQIIFGVAYWMLPKYSQAQPRRSERLGWAVFWLLNAGLLLRVAAEPAAAGAGGGWGWALGFSALLQWLAGLGFVWNSWGRVKER